MILKVDINSNDFFKQYIQILNPLFNLRKREAEILESFLRVHYKYKDLPNVNQLLFSLSTLRQIREHLNMTTASFNNHKHCLRKKKVMTTTALNPIITNNYPVKGELDITFKLKIVTPITNDNNKVNNRQVGKKIQSIA